MAPTTVSDEVKPSLFLQSAKDLALDSVSGGGAGRPRSAYLRRSTSTAYYAAFHALTIRTAQVLAPGLLGKQQLAVCRVIGHQSVARSSTAIVKKQVPNSSGFRKQAILELAGVAAGDSDVLNAAGLFLSLYDARLDADYSHEYRHSKQAALAHCEAAGAIIKLCKSKAKSRVAACDAWCGAIILSES